MKQKLSDETKELLILLRADLTEYADRLSIENKEAKLSTILNWLEHTRSEAAKLLFWDD